MVVFLSACSCFNSSPWLWRDKPRRSFFSCDSCAIYMFTLTISICCFWNNQLRGPGGEAPVNRARLGFHDFGGRWGRGLGLIMLNLRWWWWGGALKVSGGKQGLLGGVRVGSFGEASPGWDQSAGRKRSWSKLTNGFQTQTCSRNTV